MLCFVSRVFKQAVKDPLAVIVSNLAIKMRVFVTFQGKTILYSVEDDSVLSLKTMISNETYVSVENQHLFFAGTLLQNGKLSDFGIDEESGLTLLERKTSTSMCPKCASSYDLGHHLPRFLVPCCHSFCSECVLEMKNCPLDEKSITGAKMPESCPTDFKALLSIDRDAKVCEECKSDRHEATCYCPECRKFLCTRKGRLHAEAHECEMTAISQITEIGLCQPKRIQCLHHFEEEVVYFDQAAERLACAKCIPESKLGGNNFILLGSDELKSKFEDWMKNLRGQIESCQKTLNEFGSLEHAIQGHKEKLEQDFAQQRGELDCIFEELQRHLMERQAEMTKSLEECFETAKASASTNARLAERFRANLGSLIERHGHQEPPAVLNSNAIIKQELKISRDTLSWLSVAATKPSFKVEVDVHAAKAAIEDIGKVCLKSIACVKSESSSLVPNAGPLSCAGFR
jgi:hypothetical protein